MNKYLDSLNKELREYFEILSPEFPEWMLDYIYTPQMLRLDKIGVSCGTNYTKVYDDMVYNYSSLEHSVAVALIIWNFTKDKKQTISALFHDIATPVFKHSIDYMNGDAEKQESTEEKTEEIIRNSKEITDLLKRDNIKIEEIYDYHIYPIADNKSPRLCADRLEYTLSDGLYQKPVYADINSVKKYYQNIIVTNNEDNVPELIFKDLEVCEEFIHDIKNLWPRWSEDEDRVCMQFIADIVKSMHKKGYISVEDLYTHTEKEVVELILNCEDENIKNAFKNFQNATRSSVYKNDIYNDKIYCTSVNCKKRYLNPLVIKDGQIHRLTELSKQAQKDIEEFLNMKVSKYIGFNFEFKTY
mgnify:FL=1